MATPKQFLFMLIMLTLLLAVYVGEKRTIINLNGEFSLTVWKTIGGRCYIIPYKYFGLFYPRSNYILTTNKQVFALAYDKSKKARIAIANRSSSIMQLNGTGQVVKYYAYGKYSEFEKEYSKNIKYNHDYITMDVLEGVAVVNGRVL